jgi:hypothetical protein
MGRWTKAAAPDSPYAKQQKFQIRKQNISKATPGGSDFGKFALERSVLAFCRLAITNGLALVPAMH